MSSTNARTKKAASSVHPGTVWKKQIEDKGLTRLAVAKAMGVAPMSLHRVCEAEGIPSAEMTVRYARATGQEESTVWAEVAQYALQTAMEKVPALDEVQPKEKAPAKATTPAKEKAPAKAKADKATPAKETPAKATTKKTGNPQEDRTPTPRKPRTRKASLPVVESPAPEKPLPATQEEFMQVVKDTLA